MKDFIDENFLEKISELKLILKRRRRSDFSGAHTENRNGVSLEFADFKEYHPGDDFRYIDWNATARLEKIIVKRFLKKFEVPIYLLLDLSDSMSIGSPSKANFGARLAVALTHLALLQNDRVGLFPFNEELLNSVPPGSGLKGERRIIDLLRKNGPEGKTSISQAIKDFLASTREKGLVFLLSDFFTREDFEEGLDRMRFRGDDVIAVQIADPRDLRPEMPGGGTLIDAESDEELEIGGETGAVEDYREKVSSFIDGLESSLKEREITHILAPTDLPLEDLLFRKFRSEKIIK